MSGDHSSEERGYASKRSIYLVGPSSSGKTTLCRALQAAFDTRGVEAVVIKEVARTVMKSQGFTRHDVGKLAMQEAIMHAQLRTESLVRMSNPQATIVGDRSAIDPIVYASMIPAAPSSAKLLSSLIQHADFQKVLPHYRNSLFVLLRPVQDWIVDDGIRSMEDPWPSYWKFKEVLESLRIHYHELGDDVLSLEVRVEKVLEWAQ